MDAQVSAQLNLTKLSSLKRMHFQKKIWIKVLLNILNLDDTEAANNFVKEEALTEKEKETLWVEISKRAFWNRT